MKRTDYDPGHEPPETIARPKCGYCDKRLRPMIAEEREYGAATNFQVVIKSRRWLGRYHGYGAFCSTGCCERFANAAFKAGYRMVR